MTNSPRRRAGKLGLVLAALLLAVTSPLSVDAAARHTVDVADRADFVAQTNFVLGPSPRPASRSVSWSGEAGTRG